MIKVTPHFAELAEIIESVPGLGKIASAGLIAAMPELGQVSDNIGAALLGVAPYDDDSGQRRGGRHIKGGRRKVRNLFYMPCLGAATQHNPSPMGRAQDRLGEELNLGRTHRLGKRSDRGVKRILHHRDDLGRKGRVGEILHGGGDKGSGCQCTLGAGLQPAAARV